MPRDLLQQNNMTFEKRPVIITEDTSFDSVLNSACERLWDKHSKYSLRRIQELSEELDKLEKELDQFISGDTKHPGTSLPFSAKMASEK
jgi:hypothetical protein